MLATSSGVTVVSRLSCLAGDAAIRERQTVNTNIALLNRFWLFDQISFFTSNSLVLVSDHMPRLLTPVPVESSRGQLYGRYWMTVIDE